MLHFPPQQGQQTLHSHIPVRKHVDVLQFLLDGSRRRAVVQSNRNLAISGFLIPISLYQPENGPNPGGYAIIKISSYLSRI